MEIITWFTSIEDVEKTLEVLEKKWWTWYHWVTPTDFEDLKYIFPDRKINLWFFIQNNNDFQCWEINYLKRHNIEYTEINFKTLLTNLK